MSYLRDREDELKPSFSKAEDDLTYCSEHSSGNESIEF